MVGGGSQEGGGKSEAPVDQESGGGGGESGGPGAGARANAATIAALREEKRRLEGRVRELEARVAGLEADLVEARAGAERAERRAEIEHALIEAGAIDLEITAPLVEEAVLRTGEADVGRAVREIKAGKAFLFRAAPGGGIRSAAMAGQAPAVASGLEDLASEARSSGDRGDLLRYLRARRR